MGWWIANYLLDERIADCQPRACHLEGEDPTKGRSSRTGFSCRPRHSVPVPIHRPASRSSRQSAASVRAAALDEFLAVANPHQPALQAISHVHVGFSIGWRLGRIAMAVTRHRLGVLREAEIASSSPRPDCLSGPASDNEGVGRPIPSKAAAADRPVVSGHHG